MYESSFMPKKIINNIKTPEMLHPTEKYIW